MPAPSRSCDPVVALSASREGVRASSWRSTWEKPSPSTPKYSDYFPHRTLLSFADTLLALWQGLARAVLRVYEQPGHPLAHLGEICSRVPGSWGAARSDCARSRHDCAQPAVGACGAGGLWGLFAADCARRRSPLHAASFGGCYVMSVGGVCVKKPVPGRSFSVLTPPCNTWSYFS